MPGYVSVDKRKIARSSEIVAILAKKGRRNKSIVVSRKNTYYSRTSPKRLTERLEGGKKGKSTLKKVR